MKTTDFINTYAKESAEEISMVVNNLHTIMRVTADLAKRVKGSEDLDEWCKEKIAVAKSMMVTVEDYIASQQEMGGEEVPKFDTDSAERMFAESLNEEATAGSTGSPSVAVSMTSLGEMPNDMIARQKKYTNQRTAGGAVKLKKVK